MTGRRLLARVCRPAPLSVAEQRAGRLAVLHFFLLLLRGNDSGSQKAPRCFLPPETIFHYLETTGRASGLRRCWLPKAQGHLHFPRPEKQQRHCRQMAPGVGFAGAGRAGILLVYSQEAWYPRHAHLTLGAWAWQGGGGAPRAAGYGCPHLSPSQDAGRFAEEGINDKADSQTLGTGRCAALARQVPICWAQKLAAATER